jgi:hypothetical protein
LRKGKYMDTGNWEININVNDMPQKVASAMTILAN